MLAQLLNLRPSTAWLTFESTWCLRRTEELGEFERQIEERGALYTNAATSQDYTQYYITSGPQKILPPWHRYKSMVLNCLIPDEAFERKRLVIIEEIRHPKIIPPPHFSTGNADSV